MGRGDNCRLAVGDVARTKDLRGAGRLAGLMEESGTAQDRCGTAPMAVAQRSRLCN